MFIYIGAGETVPLPEYRMDHPTTSLPVKCVSRSSPSHLKLQKPHILAQAAG